MTLYSPATLVATACAVFTIISWLYTVSIKKKNKQLLAEVEDYKKKIKELEDKVVDNQAAHMKKLSDLIDKLI